MAKNKNRDRGHQPDRSSSARGNEDAKSSSAEDRAEQVESRIGSSSEIPHKGKQKRFGHN
ncbi:hypothetical protein [Streptomyces sp. NPDC088725]|uniref:hypothetical protein n=1 Tax=Streptomyces sp. NPDC088725 TaxID=3365873 RepID=UPI00382B365A